MSRLELTKNAINNFGYVDIDRKNLEAIEAEIRADERAKTIDEVVSWILSRFTYTDELNIERVHCNADTLRINLKMQLKGE